MQGFLVLLAAGTAVVVVPQLRRRALATGSAVARVGTDLMSTSVHGVGDIVRAAVAGEAAAD